MKATTLSLGLLVTAYAQSTPPAVKYSAAIDIAPITEQIPTVQPGQTMMYIVDPKTEPVVPVHNYEIQVWLTPYATLQNSVDDILVQDIPVQLAGPNPNLTADGEHQRTMITPTTPGIYALCTEAQFDGIVAENRLCHAFTVAAPEAPTTQVKYSAAIDIAPITEQIPTVQPGQTMMYIVDPKTEPVVSVHNYEVQVWLTPAATLDDTTDDILVQDIPVQLAGPNPNLTADGEHQRTMTAPTAPGTYALYTEFKADEHVVDTRSYHRFTVATSETHLIQK